MHEYSLRLCGFARKYKKSNMAKQKTRKYSIVIPSTQDNLITVELLAEKVADEAGLSEDDKDNVAIAVTEAVNNAIIHGNKYDKTKNVYVDFVASKKDIKITVRDEGNGFDPNTLSDPLAPENILKESGRGVFILRTLMDNIDFSFSPTGTIITIVKKIT